MIENESVSSPKHSVFDTGSLQIAATRVSQLNQQRELSNLHYNVSVERETLNRLPSYLRNRSGSLFNLAVALHTRFQVTGQPSDLDEALLLFRTFLDHLPVYHHDRATALESLAVALRTQFQLTGQRSDLDGAILLHRESLDRLPTHLRDRSHKLINFAVALQERFEQAGQLSDMDEAISILRNVLHHMPAYHRSRFPALETLALALQTRFQKLGQRPDIDEAVSRQREALNHIHADQLDRSHRLNNLAGALIIRHKQQAGEPSDLDEAVALLREALLVRSAHCDPDRHNSFSNLAAALLSRFNERHDFKDMDEGVLLIREALSSLPAHHRYRPFLLCNLASALHVRFEQTHHLQDIDEAITLCQEALKLLPRDHPTMCTALNILGRAFTSRYVYVRIQALEGANAEGSGDLTEEQIEDLLGAMDAFHAATDWEFAPISHRFTAARLRAVISHVSSRFHDSSLEAYHSAIELLPDLAMLGLDLESRQQTLSWQTDTLGRDAAACAIQSEKFDEAIELLEAGRGTFWSQALRLRTPLSELESNSPELAHILQNISRELEQGAFRDISRTALDPQDKVLLMEQEAIRYRQLNEEWRETVAQVRQLDGFQDFLHTKSFAMLSAAASHGPVVILNASTFQPQCAALIMRSSQDPLHVPLPQFTLDISRGLIRRLQMFPVASLPSAREDRTMLRRQADVMDSDTIFRDVLAALWMYVVHPVLCSLNLEKSDSPPRLWWLPTGPFASLPIHAAGFYEADRRDCVSDYVVSSYTPTLSTLLTPPPLASKPFKMLAAIQPVTKGQASLPYTEEELRKIEAYVPGECLVKLGLPGAPASIENVISELTTSSIVHMACHGKQNVRNSLESALLLGDDRLKVSRLMQLSMPDASLIFLSACQTAMAGEELPDESMHLAATMLFAGFRSAVATMWSIEDCDGPAVAEIFYRHIFSKPECSQISDTIRTFPDTTRAAHALHLAVTGLRDKLEAEQTPSRFVRWVPFIHLGL